LAWSNGILDRGRALLAARRPLAGRRVVGAGAALGLEDEDAVVGVREHEVGFAVLRVAIGTLLEPSHVMEHDPVVTERRL
jgi:hypothetical protein